MMIPTLEERVIAISLRCGSKSSNAMHGSPHNSATIRSKTTVAIDRAFLIGMSHRSSHARSIARVTINRRQSQSLYPYQDVRALCAYSGRFVS